MSCLDLLRVELLFNTPECSEDGDVRDQALTLQRLRKTYNVSLRPVVSAETFSEAALIRNAAYSSSSGAAQL